MSINALCFFCRCGKHPCLEEFSGAQHNATTSNTVTALGCPQSHNRKYTFEQVWVARKLKSRTYFVKGREGGQLHPLCVCTQCVSSAGVEAEPPVAPGPDQIRLPGDWCPATHPEVTHAAAAALLWAFLGFASLLPSSLLSHA